MTLSAQVQLLRELAQLDAESAACCAAALQRLDAPALREPLATFRADHLHRIQVLNALLVGLGAEPVRAVVEVRHGSLRGPGTPHRATRIEATLTALLGGKHLTDRSYALVLRNDWPPELEAVLRAHAAQEQRHVRWLQEALSQRPWESAWQAVHP
jgi:hypothetical protein